MSNSGRHAYSTVDMHFYPSIASDTDAAACVRLPRWLDDFIYDELGAKYEPSRSNRGFDKNLNATKDNVLVYLGTYFPRSFAESYLLFDSLLNAAEYKRIFSKHDCVRICSVGTGTGGDLLGLLLAIDHRLSGMRRIEIVSIEGNGDAHSIAKEILRKASHLMMADVQCTFLKYVFDEQHSLADAARYAQSIHTSRDGFDFIISSKMLNELMGSVWGNEPYLDFCAAFLQLLDSRGLLLMLDVTSPVGPAKAWVPMALNEQVKKYLAESPVYRTILPPACSTYEDKCSGKCYTQNRVGLSHSRASHEVSKICYRAIGTRTLHDEVASSAALWECAITKDNEKYCEALGPHN